MKYNDVHILINSIASTALFFSSFHKIGNPYPGIPYSPRSIPHVDQSSLRTDFITQTGHGLNVSSWMVHVIRSRGHTVITTNRNIHIEAYDCITARGYNR